MFKKHQSNKQQPIIKSVGAWIVKKGSLIIQKILQRFYRFKLQGRITLILSLILFITIGTNNLISSSLFMREYSAALQAEVSVIGENLKNQVERVLELGLTLEDMMGFEEQCADVVNKYPNISIAAVVDNKGIIYFHNDPSQQKKLLPSSLRKAVQSGKEVVLEFNQTGEQFFGFVIPIIVEDEQVGAIVLGQPKQALYQKVAVSIGTSVIVSVIFFGLSVALIIFVLSSWVTRPLKLLAGVMEQAGQGDLAINVSHQSDDEIGQSIRNFNTMISGIRSLIAQVSEAAHGVIEFSERISLASEQSYKASTNIATTMEEIMKGSTDQTTEISEIVQNMNRLSDGLNKVGSDMEAVARIVKGTQVLSQTAQVTVQTLNDKALEADAVSKGILSDITGLNKFMTQIDNIANFIKDVTEQTDLLALNAAIEAARAGEMGKGFAVVAQEVRKLAEQSADATQSITQIIEDIQQKTEVTVKAANNAMLTVAQQKAAVIDTDKAFKTIFEHMDHLINDAQSVERSVKSILDLKERTVQAVENIYAVSEEITATTEEVSANTQEQKRDYEGLSSFAKNLDEMAQKLNEAITIFKV
jgi:methyl-accepting chemotaxis protein